MKDNNKSHIVIVIITVLILISIFIIINISSAEKKNIDNKTTTTTKLKTDKTPQVFGDKITDKDADYLLIDNEKVEIKLKTFEAAVGYNIDYIYEEYSPVKVNNMKLVLMNNEEPNVFVQIDVLDEDKYYDQYEDSLEGIYNHENEIDGYIYEYKFFRGNGVYLKITKCLRAIDEDRTTLPKLDYMINSLKITK